MSSAGSTKNKPKKSSNLRILWIPGRKKQHRKGSYNPTKNGLPQTYGMQPRKNESWTLGGTMNHNKIINANFYFRDLHENNLDVTTIMTTAATTGSAMAAISNSCQPNADSQHQQQDRLQLEPTPSTSQGGSVQPQIVVGTIELNNLNGDVASHRQEKDISASNQFEALTQIEEDDEEKDRNCSNAQSSSSLLSSNNDNRSTEENNVHNAATLSISEQHRYRGRRRSSQRDRRSAEDIDSIDQADSAVDVTHEDVFDDDDQVAAEQDEERTVVLRKRKRRNRQRRSTRNMFPVADSDMVDGEETQTTEPYEKAVTCLYWSLACWDCNIS
ncbi:rho GTPase-activating protein gacH [Anopheles nili]|uniref:rho GTPase-activating protein gacH n=1 Tax=Anopheles nili TaxID=185578 RepID=UPI00237B505E|nr:rho GTPase-activating protein gacH [Anopheles nili]